MKVTKNGVTFSNEEMKDFVFPLMTVAMSKQMNDCYDKESPRQIRKMCKTALDEWYPFAHELSEKTGMKLLEKNKRGMYVLTLFSCGNPIKFNRFPNGLVKTAEYPAKKKKE